jgi:DNA-binding winged helix-turn-helix (wHTH) protein
MVEEKEISMTSNEYDLLLCIFKADGDIVSREVLMTEVM